MSENSVKRLGAAVEDFKAATKILVEVAQTAITAFEDFKEAHARLKKVKRGIIK